MQVNHNLERSEDKQLGYPLATLDKRIQTATTSGLIKGLGISFGSKLYLLNLWPDSFLSLSLFFFFFWSLLNLFIWFLYIVVLIYVPSSHFLFLLQLEWMARSLTVIVIFEVSATNYKQFSPNLNPTIETTAATVAVAALSMACSHNSSKPPNDRKPIKSTKSGKNWTKVFSVSM